ncbi:alkaline phosphatase [Labilibaculum antarcticum]|uniref:Alkaline phosphatase n=1 Tax=Labilibaculum antarcticum TaxID=1717717 RepID=A0A1Y1CED8_9BACT|nr:alkaline phosphatase [Labilibaculum antarcticum]BAX78729.1 alkaline phosphatase [Labilibaculum antarcticum]
MLNTKIRLRQILTIAILLISCNSFAQTSEREAYSGKAPKYIFYFIGDGMGLSQSNAAEAYLGALEDSNGIKKLQLSTLPNQGFYTTYALNRFITGSAAAGTALATGHKTTVNTISMDAERLIPFKTIAEMAKDKGYKVGIVSSVSIDHATPATFYAHQPTRNMYYNISLDLSKSGFNYFAGGGFKHPEGDGTTEEKNSLSNFGMGATADIEELEPNSMRVAESRGYTFVNTIQDFKKLKKGDDKIIAIAPKLAAGSSLPYSIDQENESDISLADFTEKGIKLLDNSKGFFMMVEGGKIDWASHANDAATVIKEVLQFDKAVTKAIEFYNKHPKETLILVCGDHETGGLALGFAGSHYNSSFSLLQYQNTSYEAFSNKIALYKKEHADNYSIADGLEIVKENFGLGDASKGLELTPFENQQLKDAFVKSMTYVDTMTKNDQFYLLYGSYDPFTVTACHILSHKAGIGWTSYSHTATPIPIRSIGVGSKLFTGFFDNTDIPKNLMKLIETK